MALPLFRSYVLLIVLGIFMILIEKSQGVLIPKGCKLKVAKKLGVHLPQKFQLNKSIGDQTPIPITWLGQTDSGSIVNIPSGYTVTMPYGYDVPISFKATNHNNWFVMVGEDCKMDVEVEVNVFPTKLWKEIVIEDSPNEGLIDIIIQDDASKYIDIDIEVTIPKCTVFLYEENKVLLPKGITFNPPSKYATARRNWLEQTKDGSIVNLGIDWSVDLPEGFTVSPPRGWIGVPKKGWCEVTPTGSIVRLPRGWIVKYTQDYKKNNTSGLIKAFDV